MTQGVVGTVQAVERHLCHDGFVLRHDPRATELEGLAPEKAFLACTLWLADVHAMSGEMEKAKVLFDRVLSVANDLGLLSEEYDFQAKRLVRNFPQALTHIALVNTAHNIHHAAKPAMQRGNA